jgi:hypothetical protein
VLHSLLITTHAACATAALALKLAITLIPAVGILGFLLDVHRLKRRAVDQAPTLSGAQL